MSELKAIRGPWSVNLSRANTGYAEIDTEGVAWLGLAKVAVRIDGQTSDDVQGVANAHLISAAPELYQACEALLRTWFDYHDAHSLTEAVTGASGSAADLAIAALEKARGEVA